MSEKKKFFIVFLLLVIGSFLFVGYQFVNDQLQEKKLRKEVYQLAKLDITKDQYRREIQTRGDFAIVEKAIKKYLADFAKSTQTIGTTIQSEEIASLLSAGNYQQDGPDFLISSAYVTEAKHNFNTEVNKLILACDKKEIMKSITGYQLSNYYVSLYEELMLDDTVQEDLQEAKSLLLSTKTTINTLFDVSMEVFTFLKANADSWKIEDNQIKFSTEQLVNEYNLLVSKIKNPQ